MNIVLNMRIDGDEFEPSDMVLDSYRDPCKNGDMLNIVIRDLAGNFSDAMLSEDEVSRLRDALTGWLENVKEENDVKMSAERSQREEEVIVVKGEDDLDCLSCGEDLEDTDRCRPSPRDCKHHCNHSWSHDECCWCRKTSPKVFLAAAPATIVAFVTGTVLSGSTACPPDIRKCARDSRGASPSDVP